MPNKLNTWVHVGEDRYGPDDVVPAEVARLITNPDVWADRDQDEDPAPEVVEAAGERPRGNASRDEWAAYASSRDVSVSESMTRDDIKAAVGG